jgi:prepilin signal peptidase PulO-like enzyme (type II secretory pathway)
MKRWEAILFGPYLTIGTAAALMWGNSLWYGYQALLGSD